MDNYEQLLMITILNNNENDKCEIQLNEVESIEKIKEDYKKNLGFENIDINKINLCFIDDDKDKNIINEFDDLIKYSNINSKNNNLSIELIAEISGEKDSLKDNRNKCNNLIYITNSKNSNKIIYDDKDRKINELKAENEILNIICKKYKDKLKELIEKYEKQIRDLKNFDSKNVNRELYDEKNIINNKSNINKNDIKKKEKKLLNRQDIHFIRNKCNKCGKQNDKNIFQCISCENYYLCQVCYKENSKENKRFHDHKYYFEIKFPDDLMAIIKLKEKNDKEYYEAISKFNDFLSGIFFDKDGNLSKQQYIENKSLNFKTLKNLCNELNKFKVNPLKYFENYQKQAINQKIESIKKEGNPEEMILLINQKLKGIYNNILKLTQADEAKTNNSFYSSIYNYYHI